MNSMIAKAARSASSLALAGILGTALVAGAVSPASAGIVKQDNWETAVSHRLSNNIRPMTSIVGQPFMQSAAIVAAHFDADGNFIGATLEKSAGNKMLDREAVRAVKAVKYPALPARMAGKPVTVPMEVLFSNTLRKQDRIKLRATSYEIAQKYNSDTMVASAATK